VSVAGKANLLCECFTYYHCCLTAVNNGAVRLHARVKKSRDHRFDGKPLRKTSLTNDGNLAGYSIKSNSEHCECRNESDQGCGLGDVAATKTCRRHP
jgi:hypothetical protein